MLRDASSIRGCLLCRQVPEAFRGNLVEALLAFVDVWVSAAAGEKYTNPNDTSRQPEIDGQPAASASFTRSNQAEAATVTVCVSSQEFVAGAVFFAAEAAEVKRAHAFRELALAIHPSQETEIAETQRSHA